MMQQTRTRLTLLILMGLTAVRIPLALALRMLLPDAAVAPEMNYIVSILQSIILFAVPGVLLIPRWHSGLNGRSFPVLWCIVPVAAVVLARLAATPLNAWWAEIVRAPAPVLPEAESVAGRVLFILAAAVIPAIAEEVFFRGALLTNLLQCGSRLQALVLTTLMFALLHGSLAGLPGHLIISLLLTLLMMHTGWLIVPIVGHMLFNLLALSGANAGAVIPWIAGGLLAIMLGILLVRLPRGEKRRLPLPEGLICQAILLAMAAQYLI